MPTYDFWCPSCEEELEVFCPIAERDNQTCGICEGPLVREFRSGAQVIGATHSRPIDFSKQLGRRGVFETNAAARDHERKMEEKGWVLVDKKDTVVKNWNDEISESRDRKARAGGYRDVRHRNQSIREQKRKQGNNRK